MGSSKPPGKTAKTPGTPFKTPKLFSCVGVSANLGGGLMQLVAYGAQDIYLTGNPQITFFKVVYRRHTNFATESIEQTSM
jgi:hypothetical protein